MTSFVVIVPVIVFALGLAEAFMILPKGGRPRRVVAVLSVFGLVLYVGGYITGLIGDLLQPGVDSWCWGPISSAGIVMMIVGSVGAVIMLPIEILTVIFGRKKRSETNDQLEDIVA